MPVDIAVRMDRLSKGFSSIISQRFELHLFYLRITLLNVIHAFKYTLPCKSYCDLRFLIKTVSAVFLTIFKVHRIN